jgi:hypothetical protein
MNRRVIAGLALIALAWWWLNPETDVDVDLRYDLPDIPA